MSTATDRCGNGQHRNVLQRTVFKTSREMDFFSEKELSAQTGHSIEEWPAVIIKELIDNSLDACEEHDIAPDIAVMADACGITVADNGPGIPESTIAGAMDFTVRVSSREAYRSPTRGAQGNALKTLLGMPHVLDPSHGKLVIAAGGVEHSIRCRLDPVTQRVVFNVEKTKVTDNHRGLQLYKSGTAVRAEWTDKRDEKGEIVWPFDEEMPMGTFREQITALARGYALFNPHLTLTLDWFGERTRFQATDPGWRKWRPNQPTSPHWYLLREFERLIAAYITVDRDAGTDRTVAEFLREFDGLTGSKKRTIVLEQAGMKRMHLSELATDQGIKSELIAKLLTAMKDNTLPVTTKRLGQIGQEHIKMRLKEFGCIPESIDYKVRPRIDDGVAFVLESAFGYLGDNFEWLQFYAGANWSAGIKNPFRSFGTTGEGLESVLADQRAGRDEPIVLVLHLAHPCVEYTDRGKSAIAVKE